MNLAERKRICEQRTAELIALGYVESEDGIWRPGPDCHTLVNGLPNS